ncbi:hypothetical protein [uncultured Tateyamaria sp.]|uniref:hypothetical protein n=1 Tax=uncultured Tateyamaria sp. TaxID=455651 RepID=UPI00261B34ED|nr:hypothetical protein [uncultured Tateyamaria sp.]
MTTKPTAPGSLPLNDIQFFDRHIPALHGGDYTISVKQTVASTNVETQTGGQDLPPTAFPGPLPLAQLVSVAAPRYALDPADVHAVFPPAGQVGAFDQNLASVTLTGGALPWERALTTSDNDTPYLAVLLVQADELSTPLTTFRASDILSPPPGTLGPQIGPPDRQDLMDQVTAITITNGGAGYADATLTLSGGGGTGASADAVIGNGVVTALTVDAGGSGYTTAPTVTLSGAGTGFAATAVISAGTVSHITINQQGSGYASDATVTLKGGGGSGATASATVTNGVILGATVTAAGTGYTTTPTVEITGDGQNATALAARGVQGRAIDLPTATFTALMPRYGGTDVEPRWLAHVRDVPTGDKETGTATGTTEFGVVVGNRFPAPGPGPVAELTLTATGQGYTTAPTVTITGGGGTGATAVAGLTGDQVTHLTLTNPGTGYTAPPTVTFAGGTGTGAAASARTRAHWQAHLVSLEGWQDYLGATPTWPTDPTTGVAVENVRLVSLFSWSFYCLSEAGDFRDLMQNLAAPAGVDGTTKDALLLRMPDPGPGDGSPAAASVQGAFAQGYTALEYQTRAGVDSFAWYRGPFTPLPVPPFDMPEAWDSAGSAMIYDQTTGLFDQSYAAGWQAGRLLGLSDPNFATQLRGWRRQGITLTNTLLARINATSNGVLQSVLPSPDLTQDDPDTVAELETLLEADLLSDAVMAYLTTTFAENIAPTVGQADVDKTPETTTPTATAPPPQNVVTALKSLLAQPAVAALLAKMNGTDLGDPAPSFLSYVVDWLGQLRLMDGVPFAQMVPDTRALPTESLRFFYVDPNYQKALVDGALSVGLENGHEVLYQALNYTLLADATQQEMVQTRAKLMGQTVPNPAPDPGVPLAGVLMRSSVVSGWPGLEIRAYKTSTLAAGATDPTPSAPMKALRIDRLAPDVMLVLFPEPPAWIEIGEPAEQLAFGHEDNGIVDLRWVSDGQSQPIGDIIPGRSVDVTTLYRDATAPSPVVNTTALASALSQGLTTAYGGTLPAPFDAADFAIQMVRAPEQMIFQNQAAPGSDKG